MLHIYKASAGSGKTYSLTKHYLQLLLGYRDDNPDPSLCRWHLRKHPDGANRHILAITFTNKATEEMIKRIISELAILARREPGVEEKSDYLDYFIDLFSADEESISRLASETLDDLLADFAYFHVSTIDAFFQTVLRTFAREIEMPDNFELELDNHLAVSTGVGDMLSSINRPEPSDPAKRAEHRWLTDWLTRYVNSKLDEGHAINLFARSSNLFDDLVGTFTRIMDENFKMNFDEISAYFSNLDRTRAFGDALRASEKTSLDNILKAIATASAYADYQFLHANMRKFFDKLREGPLPKDVSKYIVNYLENSAKCYTKKHVPSADFDGLISSLCGLIASHYSNLARNKVIQSSLSTFGLMGCLLRILDNYCKDNNLILLSETNSLLRDIINDDDTPFVYERIGYYLRHFLIDEFQDTSKMQWQNLRPLVMESLSHNHENLVIGDEKQCIYRFRNSDPDLLGSTVGSQVADVFGDRYISVEGTTVEKNNNWRSSREVVTFNNSIFRAMAEVVGDTETYSHVVQQISPARKKEIPGHVKLIFEPERPADENPAPPLGEEIIDNEDVVDEDFSLAKLADEVSRLLDQGYRQEDIAILVRRHSEGEKAIATLLDLPNREGWRHGNIAVTSVDSVRLSSSSAVRMIIEILRLSQVPHLISSVRRGADGTEQAVREINPAYRRSRLLCCYEYFLHEPAADSEGNDVYPTPSQALTRAIELLRDDSDPEAEINSGDFKTGREKLDLIVNFNPRSLNSADTFVEADGITVCATLSTLIDRILSRYINPSVVAKETGYITAFQDVVLEFCARGNSDIRSFLDWWDKKGFRSTLSSSDETKAITVMTIHQSKGLEFPCVIIPFADTPFVSYNSSMKRIIEWFDLDRNDFPGVEPELVPPFLPLDFTSALGKIPSFKTRFDQYVMQQRVDALNVTYVAFTRAVNELVVISPSAKEESLNDYLRRAVALLSSDYIGSDRVEPDARPWMLPLAELLGEDGVIEIGSPTSPVKKTDEKAADAAPGINIPDYSPAVNDNINTFTEADCETFDFDDPRMRGDFLHRVLSRVRHCADLDLQLRRAAARSSLSERQIAYCRDTLSAALADPKVTPWFDGYKRIVCERSMVTGKSVYRPDRVVWTADGHIDIIDFKFGEPDSRYHRQVSNYARIIRKAGYSPVRAFLWYVGRGLIEQVDLN